MDIPQNDLRAGYLAHKSQIDQAIQTVLDSGWYILGDEVKTFEEEFSRFVGASHAMGVASGTDAIQVALRACGIAAGDRVITISHTAVATVAAIELAGATPVLVDIDPLYYTIDPNQVEDVLRKDTSGSIRAIIPVHLYGQPADMDSIMEVARKYDVKVIEDCAQSHGATCGGRQTGTIGDCGCFSFYPTKNLGALGDAGMIISDDDVTAEKIRLISQYGWRDRYVSSVTGLNSRLDEVQAAILRVRLRYLQGDNDKREEIASQYSRLLEASSLILPRVSEKYHHVFHQYVVRTKDRDNLRDYLAGKGIGTLIHYPVPVHLQPAYKDRLPAVSSLEVTERIASEILSLPMFPQLRDSHIHTVADNIVKWSLKSEISGV